MLIGPMNSSSFLITRRTSNMRVSNRSYKYVFRDSLTQFLSWAPLNSSLAAVTWKRRWDKAKTRTWEFAENLKKRDPSVYTP